MFACHSRGPRFDSQSETLFSVLLATIKRARQLEVSAKSLIQHYLVKIRVVIGVFRQTESKSSLYFVLSPFLKEVLSVVISF